MGTRPPGRHRRPAHHSDPAHGTRRKARAANFTVLYLLSDSAGNLPLHMLTAFLTQFPPGSFEVHRRNFLASPDLVQQALGELKKRPGMVLHAVVDPASKKVVNDACAALNVPACDLTGSFVQFISTHSGIAPNPDVTRLHDISDEYHRRIKALEFTLEHDDGLGLETLDEADIVLAGVSRTSKTPTSVYLGQQGYKVANVSLASGVEPPRQLLELKRRTVVGLLIDPVRLQEVRATRQAAWGMSHTAYSDIEAIRDEVAWSRKLFAARGWPTLDVTHRAIEESAGKILELLKPLRT
jgi:[pyruvate, water dikinase]-phosphate phosphotransferase / [pyruvate, water dikinase] kinase